MKRILRKFSIPHVFIFLSAIILFCSLLTYVVPSGTFERSTKKLNKIDRTVVVPGTYKEIPKHFSVKGIVLGNNIEGTATPTSLLGLFSAVPKGMNQASSLIFFVFIIGAVFGLIQHTGTINVFINRLLRKFRRSPVLLTVVLYSGFSILSTFLGLAAIFIPLIPVLLMLSKEMGYDRMYGVAVYQVPVVVGWATAITNPFTVQIAQEIAEVPIGSGMGLRIIMFFVCYSLGLIYIIRYGKRVKKDASRSIMAGDTFEIAGKPEISNEPITKKHIWIGIVAFILFAIILYAVQTMGWGIIEMTGGFFTVGLFTILISGMSGDESMKAFIKGLEVMIVPALIVGFARGIQVVMQDAMIIDTILHHTATSLEGMPLMVAVEGMYVFQTVLNFFIPSASGQAMVSMPLMTPLADLIGVSRQTAVLAFTSGDGFSNAIVPTNGVLMAVLGMAGVPYEKWFKFIWPIFTVLAITAGIFLFVAVKINY